MGLDMYLYRKNPKATSIDKAHRMEKAFWKNAYYDEGAHRFVSEDCEHGFEEIGYWRKANQIHNWFAEHCGADNGDYYPVSRVQLEELEALCKDVLAHTELADGMVKRGERYTNGEWTPIMEEGKTVVDPSYAIEHLPTCTGFFFGSTDYDEWYVSDVEDTVGIIAQALDKYDDEEFYYYPSW